MGKESRPKCTGRLIRAKKAPYQRTFAVIGQDFIAPFLIDLKNSVSVYTPCKNWIQKIDLFGNLQHIQFSDFVTIRAE